MAQAIAGQAPMLFISLINKETLPFHAVTPAKAGVLQVGVLYAATLQDERNAADGRHAAPGEEGP